MERDNYNTSNNNDADEDNAGDFAVNSLIDSSGDSDNDSFDINNSTTTIKTTTVTTTTTTTTTINNTNELKINSNGGDNSNSEIDDVKMPSFSEDDEVNMSLGSEEFEPEDKNFDYYSKVSGNSNKRRNNDNDNGISNSNDGSDNNDIIPKKDELAIVDDGDENDENDENDEKDSSTDDETTPTTDDDEIPLARLNEYEHDLVEETKAIADNIFERAKESLHLDAIPEKLPGREGEKASIQAFLEPKINAGDSGGTLFIAGMPGTGKTATVKEIIKNLQNKRKNKLISPFRFIEINCMQLSNPHQLYQTFYTKLQMGKKKKINKPPSQDALKALEKRFAAKTIKKEFIVALIDEFDILITKEQTVIYNLFNWPNKEESKLVVIAISNTMNLPDQFSSRVKSRMGLQRIPFQPYNTQQLENIIRYRLGGLEAFDQDSIQLVSTRVAAVCGDARRALEICRKAVTIAIEMKEQNHAVDKVNDTHIDDVFKQFSLPIRRKLNQLSLFEKLFLYCVCKESKRVNSSDVLYGNVYKRLREISISNSELIVFPTESEILSLAGNLGGYRLILLEDDKPINWDHLLKLNISLVDLLYGLEEDEELKPIINK